MTLKAKKGDLNNLELTLISNLLKNVFPNSNNCNFEYLDWLYRKNPNGPAETYNIFDKNRIVAHYAGIPIFSNIFGENRKGLLSLNTVIHESYRGKNFFKQLAKSTYDEARCNGSTFIIGVANSFSTLLFQRQLGFSNIGPLQVKIGIGYLDRPNKFFNFDYFSLINSEIFEWRLKNPCRKYFIKEKDDSISIWANTGIYNIFTEIIWVPKFMLNESFNFKKKLSPLPKFFKNPLNLWIGFDSRCHFPSYSYMSVPNQMKPSPLNLVFLDLLDSKNKLLPEKTLFSLFDFDAY
jgi:hypothetical protein